METIYTQHEGEQEAILKMLPKGGKALEIGAWCATTFSQTRFLYERGWDLVLVEPSPGPFLSVMQACRHCGNSWDRGYGQRLNSVPCSCNESPDSHFESYGTDERVTLVLAAVASRPDILLLHATDDAVSTADEVSFVNWANGGYYGNVHVPSVTIEELWDKYGPFEFMSIDTEGMNQDVLLSIPLGKVRPLGICVEYSSENESQQDIGYMRQHGYSKVFHSTGNLLFKRNA